jgi:hypothetical protein
MTWIIHITDCVAAMTNEIVIHDTDRHEEPSFVPRSTHFKAKSNPEHNEKAQQSSISNLHSHPKVESHATRALEPRETPQVEASMYFCRSEYTLP